MKFRINCKIKLIKFLISFYLLQKEQTEEVKNERIMLTKLKHINITNMKAAWADPNYFYFVFDYALNGDYS